MKALWRRFREIDPKKLRIALFCLAGALLAAAAVVFIVLWNEGVSAGKNAQAVLDASGITPEVSGTASGTAATPNSPDNPSGTPQPTLTPELQGFAVVARVDIDCIDAHLPVLSEATREALKVSACILEGTLPGEDGNMVVTGHNYANGSIFGKLDQVKVGDTVLLTGQDGSSQVYTVYAIDHIKPNQSEKLNDTEYARELTLLTCENHGNGRLVVRCCAEP